MGWIEIDSEASMNRLTGMKVPRLPPGVDVDLLEISINQMTCQKPILSYLKWISAGFTHINLRRILRIIEAQEGSAELLAVLCTLISSSAGSTII